MSDLTVHERLADPELTDAERVFRVLQDGRWHTSSEVRQLTGGVTVNSRVADLRKRGHLIECRRNARGSRGSAYEYRLIASASERAELALLDAPATPHDSEGPERSSEGPADVQEVGVARSSRLVEGDPRSEALPPPPSSELEVAAELGSETLSTDAVVRLLEGAGLVALDEHALELLTAGLDELDDAALDRREAA